jgi:signal transduction histidine kinase/DNA-binding response OmpR family regulator
MSAPFKNYLMVFIVIFTLSIIAGIIIIQASTDRNLKGFQQGNEVAVKTFTVGYNILDIVNNVSQVENKVRKLIATNDQNYGNGFYDTVVIVKKQLESISSITKNLNIDQQILDLRSLIARRLDTCSQQLLFYRDGNLDKVKSMIASPMNRQMNDSINEMVYVIQTKMTENLKQRIDNNDQLSDRLLSLSKVVSLVSIIAIVILGTIIIRRMLQQFMLIKDLEIAKQRADKSAQVKEQFLANMSHEIRTPINAVIGFTGLLKKTPLSHDQGNYVRMIQHSSGNLLKVINDILDISKIEANKLRIENRSFNLRQSVMNTMEVLHYKMEEKKLHFETNIDGDVPDTLIGDPERLDQILTNLVNNAVKFTHNGSITLWVSLLSQKDKQNALLQFVVKDTGIGIPQDKLSTVFERFEQVDGNNTREYGGTGLGLSIVKSLVQLLKGEISVKSEVNKGSSFIFVLPFEVEQIAEMEPVQHQQIAENNIAHQKLFHNSKILVAEDNQMNQLLLEHIFKQWNLDYDLVDNGKKAVEHIELFNYDLLLLDIQMPVLDGYSAAMKIRNDLGNDIPIVAMTAHVMAGEKEKCIGYGMNDYISKPIDEEKLLTVLKEYLVMKNNVSLPASGPGAPQLFDGFSFVDVAQLQKNYSSNPVFIQKIIKQFLLQYPKETIDLGKAIKDQNAVEVKRMAHHMKSTVTILAKHSPIYAHLEKLEALALAENKDWSMLQNEYAAIQQKEVTLYDESNKVANHFEQTAVSA